MSRLSQTNVVTRGTTVFDVETEFGVTFVQLLKDLKLKKDIRSLLFTPL